MTSGFLSDGLRPSSGVFELASGQNRDDLKALLDLDSATYSAPSAPPEKQLHVVASRIRAARLDEPLRRHWLGRSLARIRARGFRGRTHRTEGRHGGFDLLAQGRSTKKASIVAEGFRALRRYYSLITPLERPTTFPSGSAKNAKARLNPGTFVGGTTVFPPSLSDLARYSFRSSTST